MDSDSNLVEAKLSCGLHCQVQVAYELGAVDLDDEPLKTGMVRELLTQPAKRLGIGQNGDRQVDLGLDRPALREETMPLQRHD